MEWPGRVLSITLLNVIVPFLFLLPRLCMFIPFEERIQVVQFYKKVSTGLFVKNIVGLFVKNIVTFTKLLITQSTHVIKHVHVFCHR